MSAFSNSRQSSYMIFARNLAPWHADLNRRGLAKPDHGGKQETNGGKLAFIRAVQAFTCHGGGRQAGGSAAFQFYQLDFYVARSFLWYFLGLQESTVSPRIPSSAKIYQNL